MDTFLEGVDVIDQPCTIAVLVPALAIVLAARRNQLAVILGYVLGVALLMWARAAIYWTIPTDTAITLLIGVMILGGFLLAWRPELLQTLTFDRSGVLWGSGILIGAISGWLWRPCVGVQLGDIFNNADTEGPRTLVMMVLYVAGAVLPAVLIAVAPIAWPKLQTLFEKKVIAGIGLAAGCVYAAAVFVGQYDELVSELLRRSVA